MQCLPEQLLDEFFRPADAVGEQVVDSLATTPLLPQQRTSAGYFAYPSARVFLVVQGTHRDRTRVDPAVERGGTEEHLPERFVVVRDAPPEQFGRGSGHENFVSDPDRLTSTPPLGQSTPEREAGWIADRPRSTSRRRPGRSRPAEGAILESRPRPERRSRTGPLPQYAR